MMMSAIFAIPIKFAFGYIICDLLFPICVTLRTISMKILVIRVINSSRHRKCFVRGYIHELFVSKSPHSLVRVLTQTTREYNPVRRTFYDVNYISLMVVSFCIKEPLDFTRVHQIELKFSKFPGEAPHSPQWEGTTPSHTCLL